MNSGREPLSPPTSPTAEEDEGEISDSNCDEEERLTPIESSDGKEGDDSAGDEEYDDEVHTQSVPSSPPTSVETPSKNGDHTLSVQVSSPVNGSESYRAPEVETEDEDGNENRRDYFPEGERYATSEDTFVHKGKVWESSSQWEDDEVEALPASSPPPNVRQSPASSRKSAPPLSSPLFPPRARQSQGSISVKSALSHRLYTRPSPASRASSGSYDPREHERKAPLVLLHITLLLLPGAEDIVLRHITPTTFERGLLVEHPRGDYNLLEEMILDGLGLDDDDYPLEETASKAEEEESSWEKALNVPSTPGKKPWQLRVYASNGLMTPGAWKRVWSEMERIDVEIWPRGFDRTNKWGVGLSSPSSTIAAAMARGGSLSGKAASVTAPIPLELGSSTFVATEFDDIEGDRNGLLTNRNSRRGTHSSNSGGTSDRKKSNHSHNNSNSSSGILRRLSQPDAPVSPTAKFSTPKSSRKSKRRAPPRLPIMDHFSIEKAKFYLDKLTTPKAVKILAGINLFLFLYFTLFKSFVGVATNSISVNWFNYGEVDTTCSVEDDTVQVVEVDMDEPIPAADIEIPEDVEEENRQSEDNEDMPKLDSLDFLEEENDDDELPVLDDLTLEDVIEDEAEGSTDPASDEDSVPDLTTLTDEELPEENDAQSSTADDDDDSTKDSEPFQIYLDDDDEPEEKPSAFAWSRWGDGLKDKLSF
ncbi:hypothetical protein L873DRAFT_1787956 [Choiromyces venosus 120613-1]|uniref:Uncharacterized protein n=1 Tax=Choiromyces venosus 120613-1 TaxID=1336337 RepID=A0A3N4K0F7_9PEZI|nr:hypothetical protein L873DRAFT_1787956 [Choiromyces venosus 120613-1]